MFTTPELINDPFNGGARADLSAEPINNGEDIDCTQASHLCSSTFRVLARLLILDSKTGPGPSPEAGGLALDLVLFWRVHFRTAAVLDGWS